MGLRIYIDFSQKMSNWHHKVFVIPLSSLQIYWIESKISRIKLIKIFNMVEKCALYIVCPKKYKKKIVSYGLDIMISCFLTHLTQRVMWGIVITCCLSLSKILHSLKSLSQLEPSSIGMFNGWSSEKFCFLLFFCWWEVQQRNRRPKSFKKGCDLF